MINRSQFIIAKTKYIWNQRVRSQEMHQGFVLSYDKDIDVFHNAQKDVFLIGDAWQTIENELSPEQLIQQWSSATSSEDVFAAEYSWCGRYILIVGDRLFTDACGLLGVYYSKGLISSSLSLIVKYRGIHPKRAIIADYIGMDWQPAPETIYPDVWRLLPSQVLDFENCSTTARELIPSRFSERKDVDKLISTFIHHSDTSLRNMRKRLAGKIYLTLTGGHDSRTQLALFEHAGIDFECYTNKHSSTHSDDYTIPHELCKVLNRKHFVNHEQKLDTKLKNDYKEHTHYMADDGQVFCHRMLDNIMATAGGCIIVQNHLWEIAIDYYKEIEDNDYSLNKYYFRWSNIIIDKEKRHSIEKYEEWVRETPQKRLSMRNRFMLEQRVASWVSSNMQGTDIMDNTKYFHLANSRLLLDILLSFPLEMRAKKLHQKLITQVACPAIADIRYGEPTYRNIRMKVLLTILRQYGLWRTIALYTFKLKRLLSK